MPQFFIKSFKISGSNCVIDGDNFHHLTRVRRIKEGDSVSLRREDGALLAAVIKEIGNDSIIAEILESSDIAKEPIQLTVAAGLLKGKHFDAAVRKFVEIGAARIIPVISERTVSDISRKEKNKLERWRKISEEASKQSMRSGVPEITDPASFNEVITDVESPVKILAHARDSGENLREYFSRIEKNPDVTVLIGPEGGFSDSEVESAVKHGWASLKFGNTCLRAETAALIIPAIIIYEWSMPDETHS
jgi:16S rRNA (uracil1498-N3)-methyltransferase